MCPFCMTTIGLIVAGTVSTGGLAAWAVKLSANKSSAKQTILNSQISNQPSGSKKPAA